MCINPQKDTYEFEHFELRVYGLAVRYDLIELKQLTDMVIQMTEVFLYLLHWPSALSPLFGLVNDNWQLYV